MQYLSDLPRAEIKSVFTPKLQPEGVGAYVNRFIRSRHLPSLDPFLVFDQGFCKLPGGVPDHPHRGIDTVLYVIEGEMLHEDFMGNSGSFGPGDLQWMTAGRGVVHAEMPSSSTQTTELFNLWLNLDRKNKFCVPGYQEFKTEGIPVYEKGGVRAKVISGEVLGVQGPVKARTPVYYIDFEMGEGAGYQHVIPKGWNSLLICYRGSMAVAESQAKVGKGDACVLKMNPNSDTQIRVTSRAPGTKFILLAGQPINEPVASYGPFSMNERSELYQAFDDFRLARNGFEGADTWQSEIKDLGKKTRTV